MSTEILTKSQRSVGVQFVGPGSSFQVVDHLEDVASMLIFAFGELELFEVKNLIF